ncbi:MAG: ribulose-phosphate 3-epimerase [Candidatus Glassbacteria bacterium]|nr:ribulose-phosphate 3-epimerase [Candidatus Glassbacteria bacterium]
MSLFIHPSILNADHHNMQSEFDRVVAGGADGIHLDIMDGKFVEPVTFDLGTIERYTAMCGLPFDAHLMIVEPEKHADDYIAAGADLVTFHLEVAENPERLIDHLHGRGVKAGITVNPDKSAEGMIRLADRVDLVLFMSVFPGYGGQKFMPEVLENVRALKRHCVEHGIEIMIQIDGGINLETAPRAVAAGVNNLVAGTFIFRSPDYGAAIQELRRACEKAESDF